MIVEHDMQNVLKWFKVHSMRPNSKKLQLIILGQSTRQSIMLNINNINIKESSSVVLLGLTIDNQSY